MWLTPSGGFPAASPRHPAIVSAVPMGERKPTIVSVFDLKSGFFVCREWAYSGLME